MVDFPQPAANMLRIFFLDIGVTKILAFLILHALGFTKKNIFNFLDLAVYRIEEAFFVKKFLTLIYLGYSVISTKKTFHPFLLLIFLPLTFLGLALCLNHLLV